MSLEKKLNFREGEKIEAIVRRFGFLSAGKYVVGLALMFLVSFFMFWLFGRGWWGYALYGFGIVVGAYIILHTWFFNYFTMLVVTNERVTDIHRVGWFDEIVSSVGFHDIEDISLRKRGLADALLSCGTLYIQTKSQQYILEVEKVHHPHKVHALITEVSEQYRERRRLSNTNRIFSDFKKIIRDLTVEQAREVIGLLGIVLEQEAENDT